MIIESLFWEHRKNIYDQKGINLQKTIYLTIAMPSFVISLLLWAGATLFPQLWLLVVAFFILSIIFFYKMFKLNEIGFNPKKSHEIFLTLKKINNPDFFTLKKQELLLKEIKIIDGYHYGINLSWELNRINGEIEKILKNNTNNPHLKIQKHITDIFERIILGNINFDDEIIIKNHYQHMRIQVFIRCIIEGFYLAIIPVMLFMLWFYINPSIEELKIETYFLFHSVFTFALGLIVWLIFLQKPHVLNANLDENFSILTEASKAYLEIISREKIHHIDQLLFAELINCFSENILNRKKNLEKYEKTIKKRYHYFYILRFSIPQEIQNFFIEAKSKLRNDAFLVQKIIEKWVEIEKSRLEKNSQNNHHPAIIASEKRRELMIKNLQNISKQ